jgi:1,4-dihydroxy-2-naphthoate octaprenyltransferase
METIDRLELIQHSLKVLRAIMLVLSVVLLLISVINSNAVFLEALMIAAFSVILYIGKELSPVSYRVPLGQLSSSS